MTDLDTRTNATLTAPERQALHDHEQVIERDLAAFHRAGNALLAIRAGNLYRETHATFEAYCADRWGMSDRHARRLIESAVVITDMQALTGPIGPVPATESQARELVGLPPEVAVEVMSNAARSGPVTARTIRVARTNITDARKQRRRALPEDMWRLWADLQKFVQRAEKIAADDRFPRYRDEFHRNYDRRMRAVAEALLNLTSTEAVSIDGGAQ